MLRLQTSKRTSRADWQAAFETKLPEIRQCLHQAFWRLERDARDEAIAEGVAHTLISFRRLHDQGRAANVTASNLAWFAAKQVRAGRTAVGRQNSKEPLAAYAQQRRGIRVSQLNGEDPRARDWIDAIASDRRTSVVDLVAARLDISAWLSGLCGRNRLIATNLAQGDTTSEAARKFGVTAGRISQLRLELAQSWAMFQHEPAPTRARK